MWWSGSRKAGRDGLRTRNPCLQNLFEEQFFGNSQIETVRSRFDRDCPQAGEISFRIEPRHIAGNLDPADSIRFHIAKTSR